MDFRHEIHDEQIMGALKRLLSTGANPRPTLAAIGRYGVSSTRLRFRTQTGPDGVRWKPSQRALEDGGQTLRLTGRLRNSLTYNADDRSVEWGTNVKYGAAHQFGVDRTVTVRTHVRQRKKIGAGNAKNRTRSGFTYRFKTRVKVDGKAHYVKAHSRRMNIPVRPFLGVNDSDRLAILKLISEDFNKVMYGGSG